MPSAATEVQFLAVARFRSLELSVVVTFEDINVLAFGVDIGSLDDDKEVSYL